MDGTNDPARRVAEVYDELRSLARHLLRFERADHTLDATAVVNEAYLRLAASPESTPEDPLEFRAAAAVALRRVLVDHARRRARLKRGGGRRRLGLATDLLPPGIGGTFDVLAVDDAISALHDEAPRVGQVAELRIFGGLGTADVARRLDVGTATVERDWRFARAWLFAELIGDDAGLAGAAAGDTDDGA